MSEVRLFFRNKAPGAFSIHLIFEELALEIIRYLTLTSVELPKPSNSIVNLIINIITAKQSAIAGINHITGDAHYIALGILKGHTVLTIHDCILLARTPKWNPKFWIYKWLWYDLPVWKADVVTTISDKSKADIISYTGCRPDKIHVIPNFVHPIYQFTPKIFNTACPRILHLGINQNKNLERVIPALAGIPCIFEIIGAIDKPIIQLLDQHQIKYENGQNLSLEVLVGRYRAADVVVFASTYEGFGMPIIEAQASGRPVVTSTLEPMPWVAGPEGACFVNPFEIQDIRAGIIRVIQDETYRNKLIHKGLENVQRFTCNAIARQYLDLYHSISPPDVRHNRHP